MLIEANKYPEVLFKDRVILNTRATMPADENFEMTQDEMRRIKEAMKNEEFMKLLIEYTKEIQDPDNKKKYEEEIIAMEKQRGNNVRLLSPQSGFVVKTERLTDGMKIFVNICTSPEIRECSYTADIKNGRKGTNVSIPHSLIPGREDIDKAGKPCIVFDVCFHPKTYAKSLEDIKFRGLLVDSAFDTLEKQGNTVVDRKKKRFPKMKYKGMVQTNIIRPEGQKEESDIMPMDDLTKETLDTIMDNNHDTQNGVRHIDECKIQSNGTTLSSTDKSPQIATPDYKIVHRGYFDMQNFTYAREDLSNVPKELVVEIKLPLAKSAAGIDLDIFEKELVLDSKDPPYHLEISLPYKVNEADGQAQFDAAGKTLVVTLPVVKPETKNAIEITPQPSVIDITPIENENMDNGLTNNLDSSTSAPQDQTINDTMTTNMETVESVSSMLSNNLPDVDDNMNGDVVDDDDTVLVDVDMIREHLGKNINEELNNVDIEFDTSNFKCFRPSSKLPPYCYTQSDEQVNLTISIPQVKVVYLSLGFSEQQAYMSYPRNPDDANSPFWELVIRLDENCYLDKDNCGVDVTDEHMELILRKRHDSQSLWEKFFVGLAETSLTVEFFNTESIAEDMLKSISVNNTAIVEMDESNETEVVGLPMEKKLTNLESRLSQLLQSQENLENEKDKQAHTLSEKNSMNFKESNGALEEDEDNPDNDESDISSKLNEVKINGNSDSISPDDHKLNGRVDSTTEDESPSSNRQLYGRSLSLGNDSSYDGEGVLHSILKMSRSDSEYYCDTEEDDLSCSANSFTDSIFDDSPAPEPTLGRRRIKSVTFNDEPIIFEFAKLSKRQLKKQMKEERLRQAQQHKGIFSKFSQSAPPSTNGTDNEQTKGKSKKKDKCEKKNRSYSDGLLQVPNSILTRHKIQKKKKKNKKNNKQDSEESPSNSLTDISSTDNETDKTRESTESTTVLSNPLIFELE